MPVSMISPILGASRVLKLHLRHANQSSGMAKELARNTKSKLLLLVRYCYMK